MTVYAVCNQKGGQGKTTTAAAMFDGLQGKNLAIDLDPQSNFSIYLAADTTRPGSYEAISGKSVKQTIQTTQRGDIIAASPSLALADIQLKGEQRRNGILSIVEQLQKSYDNIIIDCPPALNVLLINALAAAHKAIIPTTPDIFSYAGLIQLQNTIRAAQVQNRGLTAGILFTRTNPRTNLNKGLQAAIEETARKSGLTVYSVGIRECLALREAQLEQQSIFEYAPKSNAAKDYRQFIDELTAENRL